MHGAEDEAEGEAADAASDEQPGPEASKEEKEDADGAECKDEASTLCSWLIIKLRVRSLFHGQNMFEWCCIVPKRFLKAVAPSWLNVRLQGLRPHPSTSPPPL